MNDVEVSSARARAALSAFILKLPYPAQRPQAAVLAGVALRVYFGTPLAEIRRQTLEHALPLRRLLAERTRRFDANLLHRGQGYAVFGNAAEPQFSGANLHEGGARSWLVARSAIQRKLRLIRTISFPPAPFYLPRLVIEDDLAAAGPFVDAIRAPLHPQSAEVDDAFFLGLAHRVC